MKNLKEYLKNEKPEQYHIFDSHQEALLERGMDHKDQDYVAYSYNIHKNNKPKAGDIFLYRRPGKSTPNRKFNIYGGGVIESISLPDDAGNVVAKVRLPFKFNEPLEQKTEKLEKFEWTSKNKKEGTWEHFWNQYGMNLINGDDFWRLVENQEFFDPTYMKDLKMPSLEEAIEEETGIVNEFDLSNFELKVNENSNLHGEKKTKKTKDKKTTAYRIDYCKLQEKKTSVGKIGEYLVLEYLRNKYNDNEVIIEHVAETEGDCSGYDIKITFPDKSQNFIEVKTTSSANVDGFYLTPNELSVAMKCFSDKSINTDYSVYRIYNLNTKTKTADIKIYDSFNPDDFNLAPTCWKVYLKFDE